MFTPFNIISISFIKFDLNLSTLLSLKHGVKFWTCSFETPWDICTIFFNSVVVKLGVTNQNFNS